VRCLLQDRDGKVWAGTCGGGVSVFDGREWTTYRTAQGLGSDSVLCLLQDRDGKVWAGTGGGVDWIQLPSGLRRQAWEKEPKEGVRLCGRTLIETKDAPHAAMELRGMATNPRRAPSRDGDGADWELPDALAEVIEHGAEKLPELIEALAVAEAEKQWEARECKLVYEALMVASKARTPPQIAGLVGEVEERLEALREREFMLMDAVPTLESLRMAAGGMRNYQRSPNEESQLRSLNTSRDYLTMTRTHAEETLFPSDEDIVSGIVHHWEEAASLAERAPAQLQLSLLTREAAWAETLDVMVEVVNESNTLVEELVVTLLPGTGYAPIAAEQRCEFLGVNDSAQLRFRLAPQRDLEQLPLTFRARYLDDRRRSYEDTLTDTLSFSQRVGTFQRIDPNPYHFGAGFDPRSLLFRGRQAAMNFLRTRLRAGKAALVVVGERRLGKTAVLMRQTDLDGHVPCYLTCQDYDPAYGLPNFYYQLACAIADGLACHKAGCKDLLPECSHDKVIEPPREQSPELPTWFRREFLPQVLRLIGDHRLLLLMDETESLVNPDARGATQTVLGNLRSLMQQWQRVSFVFAGTHELEGREWAAFFNETRFHDLELLSAREQDSLIRQPDKNLHLTDIYEEPAIALISEWAGQYPAFVQLVCEEVVNYRNEAERAVLTRAEMEKECLSTLLTRSEAIFSDFFGQRTTDRERILLCLLAHEHHQRREVVASDLPSQLRRWGHNAAEREAFDTLERLRRRKFVNAEQCAHQIGLFREWMIQEKLEAFEGGSFQW
jgi:hypothetical protein